MEHNDHPQFQTECPECYGTVEGRIIEHQGKQLILRECYCGNRWTEPAIFENNELILVDDWWTLRHVINRPDMKGSVILATFNSGIFTRAEVAHLFGYTLAATPEEFFKEVARGDFAKWEITE